mmetsp:Transcript_27376/g.43016  ORF Transcript_27376/g.43016 Transcript_27376/m.43016 type:complete len:100 (+) Transcript_27376:99-398(+)
MLCKSMDLWCDDGLCSDRRVCVLLWMLWEANAQLWPVASAKRKATAGAGSIVIVLLCMIRSTGTMVLVERFDAGGGGGMVLVEEDPARSCRAAADVLVL